MNNYLICKACNQRVIVAREEVYKFLLPLSSYYNIICDKCIKYLITKNKGSFIVREREEGTSIH